MGHGLKYKNKTINLLEKNPGEYLPDLGLGRIFGLDELLDIVMMNIK